MDQPPVAKKVDTCFRILHQEDNKAVFLLIQIDK